MTFIPQTTMTRRTYERLLGYVLAVLLSVLALLLTQVLEGLLVQTSFILFMAAVSVTAWVGGFGAGIVATLISIVLHDLLIIVPLGTILFNPGDIIRLSVMLLVAGLISYLEGNRRTALTTIQDKLSEMEVMIATIADGVTAQRLDGTPSFANAAAMEILGYRDVQTFLTTPIQMLQSTVVVLDEARQPMPASALPRTRVLRDKKSVQMALLIVNKETGLERWVNIHAAPVLDDEGEVRLIVNIFRDITERRLREGELLELAIQLSDQKARLDRVIGNVPGIIWDGIGAPGKESLDYVSAYAERMTKYTVADWQSGTPFFKRAVPPQDYPQVIEDSRRIFESGQPGTMQFPMIDADGRMLHLEAHTSMIFDSSGALIGGCGVIMDITERKHQEMVLEQATIALRNSNKELEQFAYVASHDLQEPLRMVTSYLQLLEKHLKDKLDDDTREYIGFAVDGAMRMKKLISDLLSYSRLQRGDIAAVSIDLNEIMAQVLQNLAVAIEECGVAVTVDRLPTVLGDEVQLTQLLQNLVGNAVKFCAEDPTVHIGVVSGETEYTISVRDNGIGIDPQFFDRIFIIFQRLHGIGEYEGTGIGLAICKKIVQRHGGRIWVESQSGKGATFYFTLPLAGRSQLRAIDEFQRVSGMKG